MCPKPLVPSCGVGLLQGAQRTFSGVSGSHLLFNRWPSLADCSVQYYQQLAKGNVDGRPEGALETSRLA
jgi:hypothetical protein